jgi:ParB family chromosome partitioning protein
VATKVGKSRSAITNTLRLMSLPAAIQALLADGRLSAGHAKALLGTPDRAFQEQLARRASTEGWSVRMLEDAVRDRNGGVPVENDGARPTPAKRPADGAGVVEGTKLRPPGLLELEHLLAEHLSTRVSVTTGAHRGKVVIDFADLEDLERIYHRMTTGSDQIP